MKITNYEIRMVNKNNMVLNIVFGYYFLMQTISIFRATAIYNTSYIGNIILFIISLYIFSYIIRLRNLKLQYIEAYMILVMIPVFFMGLYNGQINRHLLTDIYNILFFILLYVYSRHTDIFNFYKLKKISYLMSSVLFFSLLIYRITPIFGVKVYSLGSTSIMFLFPIAFYIASSKKIMGFIHIILLFLASKRGVILSLLVIFIIYGFGNRRLNFLKKLIVVLFIILLLTSILYFTLSPSKIEMFPKGMQRLMYKTMYINPISEYNRIERLPRITEAYSAIRPLLEDPVYFLFGMGAGYNYNWYNSDGSIAKKNHHNAHITPITILTKYGLIFLIAFYFLILRVLFKVFKAYRKNELSLKKEVLFYYVLGAFVNSFTAYTLLIDYLFIISLGCLMNIKQEL